MRKMKDSGVEWIGEIPQDWEVVPMNRIYIEHKCKNIGNKVKKVLSLSYGRIVPRDISGNMGLLPESFETYNIIGSDNIVLRLTDMQNDQKSLRTGLVKERGIITSAYVTLKTNCPSDSKYNHYLLHTYDVMKIIYNMGNGVRQNLKYAELSKLPLVVPPLVEQQRIANFLERKCAQIDAIIAKQQEVIEKLKSYKQSVITEAVTKGLDTDVPMKDGGIEWIGKIPAHWKIGTVYYGSVKIGSGKTPRGGADVYSESGILFLRSQNIYDTGLKIDDAAYISEDIDEEMCGTRVYPQDVLLNITGGSIGRACLYPQGRNHANVNQHVCIIRVKDNFFMPEYMYYFWVSDIGQISIDIHQSGANREGMNFKQIAKTKIPYLSLKEQKRIVNYLNDRCLFINTIVTKKQTLTDKLIQYKKSLIYEAVTGKLEV